MDDTNVKVAEVVASHLAYDLTAEELSEAFPHLTRGQVYSALAYYYDHQAEMDAELQRRSALMEEIRGRTQNATLAKHLHEVKSEWRP